MRAKVLLSFAIIILILHTLFACDSLVNQLDSITENQLKDAQARLDTKYEQLPSISGAILIEKKARTISGGTIEGCGAIGFEALYATNDLTFSDVLDSYTQSLVESGWQVRSISHEGRSFHTSNFSVGVSNLFDMSQISMNTINQAKSNFKTIYLLELNTSIIQPLPARCHDQ